MVLGKLNLALVVLGLPRAIALVVRDSHRRRVGTQRALGDILVASGSHFEKNDVDFATKNNNFATKKVHNLIDALLSFGRSRTRCK